MGLIHKKSGVYFIVPVLTVAAIILYLPRSGHARAEAAPNAGPVHRVLDKTLEPQSNEIIDCRDGSIMPRKLAEANRGVSVPDTLIHLGEGVEGAQILNCRLEATFPIVITGGKGHRISGNNIRSTINSVTVFNGENVMIEHNRMRSMGINVEIRAGSKDTLVYGNLLEYQPGGRAAAGIPGIVTGEDPGEAGRGVYAFALPGVNYFVINDRLIQILTYGETRLTGTKVLENIIDLRPGSAGGLGIVFATRSSDSLAQGNIVFGGEIGLGVFGVPDEWIFREPGVCSGDPSIYCHPDDGVCELIGAGECDGSNEIAGGGRVFDSTFMDNRVSGAGAGFLGGFSEGLTVKNNHLEQGNVGMVLNGYAFESTTTIKGNIASRNRVGLRIEDEGLVPNPELNLSYNDFGDNDRAFDAYEIVYDSEGEVIDLLPYLKETTFSQNWWGGDSCGFPQNQEQWPNVDDPTAAAAPIAAAWRAQEADAVPLCDVDE